MKQAFWMLLIASLATSIASGAGDVTAGKAAYDRACKSCHGANGQHNPGIAKAMKVDMQDLGSSAVQSMSDADLRKAVTDGFGKMKPVRSISGADLDNVIAYMRTFR